METHKSMDFGLFKKYMNTADNFNMHNGLVVTEIGEGVCELEVELSKCSMNPQGGAHGGLIFTMCDVSCGVAAISGGRSMLTLNSNISFLRPGTGKKLRARAECVKDGRTIGLFEAKVFDDEDKLIAKGEFTMYYTGEKIVFSSEEKPEAQFVWGSVD